MVGNLALSKRLVSYGVYLGGKNQQSEIKLISPSLNTIATVDLVWISLDAFLCICVLPEWALKKTNKKNTHALSVLYAYVKRLCGSA